jgi:hypothetical protein
MQLNARTRVVLEKDWSRHKRPIQRSSTAGRWTCPDLVDRELSGFSKFILHWADVSQV